MNRWQEILARVIDGEAVSSDEAAALRAALSEAQLQQQARTWLTFEFTLTGHLQNEGREEVSRDRLLARVMLREKHREVAFEEADADSDSGVIHHSNRQSADSLRRASRLWSPAVVMIAIVLIIVTTFRPAPYAAPSASGDYHVLGAVAVERDGRIERGDRIVSGGLGATIEMGDYCLVELAAHTEVTVSGSPHHEIIELHQGYLRAKITPEHGHFAVHTPLGPVTVKGTEFETTVEYPNGMPGDLSMNTAKKVLVTVAVMTGSVLCELGDDTALLETGARQVFAQEVDGQKTSGEVAAVTDSTVTLKPADGELIEFQIGENKLTIREASQLLKGDKVTVAWIEDGGRRWIRDIDGEGVLEGTVTGLGDAWIEVQTGGQKLRMLAPWRAGEGEQPGGPDRDIVRKIGQFHAGDEVTVNWAMPEGKRVLDIRLRKAADLTKAPPELYGLSGRVIGRLVSKDVEQGELTLKIVEVDRVWKGNKAKEPESAEGRTLKIDGVFGKFLDVLLTLKEGDGVQIEVKHVRGDGLTFLGEELKRVELEAEKPAPEREPRRPDSSDGAAEADVDAPAGLHGFRGILIGELVSKDVEKGTLVLKMEKVQRVWKANKAPAPEKSVGKPLSVEGISGKFLDTLLVLEVGDRIEVEAFHVRGPSLKFPGEWLKKAE